MRDRTEAAPALVGGSVWGPTRVVDTQHPPPFARHDGRSDRAVELCRGLWQVAGEGISHAWDAAAYLVDGDRPLLVDCGSPLGAWDVRANIDNVTSAPVDTLLVTHGHWDHAGGAPALRRRTGMDVFVHEADADTVRSGDPVRTTAGPLYDQTFPGFEPDAVLRDGQRFETGGATVDVLHTPGHTPGSMCLVCTIGDQRILIAADTLWGGFHPAIGSDVDAWRASLARLAALDVDTLTFGHGPPRLLDHAHERVLEAGERFGFFFDPWHRPSFKRFRW